MSKVVNNGDFTTKLKDEQFLRVADNSTMGVLIIQRGYLQYFNKKFSEIFGYTKEEILNWKKREFYKIIHPEDLPNLVQKFQIEDTKTVSIKFRGITKQGKIIPIENYVCKIKYQNNIAFLSSYVLLNSSIENNNESLKILIEFKGELARNYKKYFEYLKLNFNINKKEYLEGIIKEEINSRNLELKIF